MNVVDRLGVLDLRVGWVRLDSSLVFCLTHHATSRRVDTVTSVTDSKLHRAIFKALSLDLSGTPGNVLLDILHGVLTVASTQGVLGLLHQIVELELRHTHGLGGTGSTKLLHCYRIRVTVSSKVPTVDHLDRLVRCQGNAVRSTLTNDLRDHGANVRLRDVGLSFAIALLSCESNRAWQVRVSRLKIVLGPRVGAKHPQFSLTAVYLLYPLRNLDVCQNWTVRLYHVANLLIEVWRDVRDIKSGWRCASNQSCCFGHPKFGGQD